jgi:hypothetical protein
VRKLIASKVQGNGGGTVSGGPKGWVCTGSQSKSGLAFTGQCSPSAAASFLPGSPGFAWTVVNA